MSIKRSKRVQLIIDIASNAEKQAARNLSAAQAALSSDKQRLKEVSQYYDTYSAHFAQRTVSLKASELSRSREFLANLDNACKAQASQVEVAEKNVGTALGQWRQCHGKIQTLESFQQRCAKAEQREQYSLEQKLLDELSASAHRYAV